VKSTAEKLSETRVRLAVELSFDELKPSLDAAYKKIGAQIRVPGFRPGKVPARIIDQRVGRAAVLEEAVNDVLPKSYVDAAREHDVRALGQPDIEVTNLADHESLSFTAEVDVRPDITLPSFDDLTVTVDDVEVSDADVDEQVQNLRERFGTLVATDRPIENGDFVSIDLTASIDGEEIDAGSANGMSYEVGSADLVDGLDDALIGHVPGDTVTFHATLQQGDRAGEQADIAATVNSVKVKELPELDDEFAAMASEFDTVAELRDDLRRRLESVRRLEQGAQARDRLVDQLLETVEFPVPESAVAAEVGYREHEVVHQLGHDDTLFERYIEAQGQSRDEFTAELRDGAQKSVRAQFLLDALAEQTDVQVGNDELTEYLVRQASRYDMAPQEFANQIMQSGNLPALVADVRRNKALAELLQKARVVSSSGTVVDLNALALDAASPGAGEAASSGAGDEVSSVAGDAVSSDAGDAGPAVTPPAVTPPAVTP